MGLGIPALRFLVRLHRAEPFQGPVLTLGRQFIFATYAQVLRILRQEGIEAAEQVASAAVSTNIPGWQRTGHTSDLAFFSLLGLPEASAMDVSDYERPDFIHDLSAPVPPELCERFGLIIDGGTLEHVFDVRQCLVNISKMLKQGGRVVHMSPASNFIDHGYYCLSPRLFSDFYAANKFVNLRAWLTDSGSVLTSAERWKLYEYQVGFNNNGFALDLHTPNPVGVLFCAEKTAQSTCDAIPRQKFEPRIQSSYPDERQQDRSDWRAILKRTLPWSVWWALGSSWRMVRAASQTLRRLPSRAVPGLTRIAGLRYVGRI